MRSKESDDVSSNEKLSETQLPPKEEFYSKLNDEDITDDDYQHAINVWNTFKCKTIRDYHDLYLKSDVLLLSDVFENFRKTCLKHYNLDPAHISKRYAEANNEHMVDYIPDEPSTYII